MSAYDVSVAIPRCSVTVAFMHATCDAVDQGGFYREGAQMPTCGELEAVHLGQQRREEPCGGARLPAVASVPAPCAGKPWNSCGATLGRAQVNESI